MEGSRVRSPAAALVLLVVCAVGTRADLAWIGVDVSGTPPSARCDHVSVSYNNAMYVYGGYAEEDGVFDDLYKFDVLSHTWSKVNVTGSIPAPRTASQAAVFGSKLVVVGGMLSETDRNNEVIYIDLALAAPSWVVVTPTGDVPPPCTWSTALATSADGFLLYGGVMGTYNSNSMYILNVTTWVWSKVTYNCSGQFYLPPRTERPVEYRGDVPTSLALLAQFAMELASDPNENLATIYDRLTGIKGNISSVTQQLNDAIDSGASFVDGVGASNDTARHLYKAFWRDLLDSLDTPSCDDNSCVETDYVRCGDYQCPTRCPDLQPPTEGTSVVRDGPYIYLFGGWYCDYSETGGNNCFSSSVYRFHLAYHSWEVVATGGPIFDFADASLWGRDVYIFGGARKDSAGDWQYSNAVRVFNLDTFTWSTVPAKGIAPQPRWSHRMFRFGDEIITFGGCYAPTLFFNDIQILKNVTIVPSRAFVVGSTPGLPVASSLAGDTGRFAVQGVDDYGVPLNFGGDSIAAFGLRNDQRYRFVGGVHDALDGVYNVSFSTSVAGSYDVTVYFNLVEIDGSPFRVVVHPLPAIPTASSVGSPSSAVQGVLASFSFYAKDVFGNPTDDTNAHVTVEPTALDASLVRSDTGSYQVQFTPRSPGSHVVHVRINGTDVFGSPVTVVVAPPSSSSNSAVGIIVGVTVGGVAAIAIVAAILLWRQSKRNRELDEWKIDTREIVNEMDDRINRSGSLAGSVGVLDSEEKLTRQSRARGPTGYTFDVMQWRGNAVSLQRMFFRRSISDGNLVRHIRQLRRFRHQNLVTFFGVCCDGSAPLGIVTEYCHKGSLSSILYSRKITLGQSFYFSFATDIAAGLEYLHRQGIVHTRFSSMSCLVDNRWIVKLAAFGFDGLFATEPQLTPKDVVIQSNRATAKRSFSLFEEFRRKIPSTNTVGPTADTYASLCVAAETIEPLRWMAPEVLLGKQETFESNSYTFGVILKEMLERREPWNQYDMFEWHDARAEVAQERVVQTITPEDRVGNEGLANIAELCFRRPERRPSSSDLVALVRKNNPNRSKSVIDRMSEMLERYASNLERLVQERTQELSVEKQRTEELLLSILPGKIVQQLKSAPDAYIAERYENVTVFFSDIVSFTDMSRQTKPETVVQMLNDVFSIADMLTSQYEMTKIKTIGDAYMAACGVPEPVANHAANVAMFAIDFMESARCMTDAIGNPLRMRCGIHSGPLVAGVVGTRNFAYDLWGDTVNVASRMESNGEPNRVCVSPATYNELKDHFDF
eukprot:Opistho-1_new@61340